MNTNRLTLDKVLRLIDTTVEALDSRLNGHSEQVAYIVYKIAQELGVRDKKELKTLCKTAFLHDVGCYKTKDQNNRVEFEIFTPHTHAAYGYAFLTLFDADDVIPDLVKWHHVHWHVIQTHPEIIPEMACLIHLADIITGNINKFSNDLQPLIDTYGEMFCPAHLEAFLRINEPQHILAHLKSGIYKAEIRTFFSQFILTDEEMLSFAKMMSYALDFHSNTTVLHSILVTGIANKLAALFAMTEEEKRNISIAAALHDVGKLVIPTIILEKPEKLTPYEYEIMKYHGIAGYEILTGLYLNTIRDIASLHHEKLDGTGYPFGLKADELSFSSRLLAIADIGAALIAKRSYKEAFPKHKIFYILQSMAEEGKIDQEITYMFCNHFDEILTAAEADILPTQKAYEQLNITYENALQHIHTLDYKIKTTAILYEHDT